MAGSDFIKLGLLGKSLSHSLSPCIHRAFLQECGLEGDYELVEVASLDFAVSELRSRGFAGVNVTIPYKTAILDWLSQLSPEANLALAVNTISFAGENATGFNTDIYGFKQALKGSFITTEKAPEAIVLGAGGAARAALIALSEDFSRISVVCRDVAKGESMIQSMIDKIPMLSTSRVIEPERIQEHAELLKGAVLVVNATPLGQKDEELPTWLPDLLKSLKDITVFDLVYARGNAPTPLCRLAYRLGKRQMDGTGMLIEQARAAFQIWTGVEPPRECGLKALRAALAR
jgi:shikimate dehydrogenase